MVVLQILEALWAGVKIGFHTFFSVLPFYEQLSSIPEQMWAAILGVPVFVISAIGIGIKVFKFVKNHA